MTFHTRSQVPRVSFSTAPISFTTFHPGVTDFMINEQWTNKVAANMRASDCSWKDGSAKWYALMQRLAVTLANRASRRD